MLYRCLSLHGTFISVRSTLILPFLVAAIAAHGIMSGSFPWLQGKFDMMLGKQLMAVSAEDKKKAAAIAAPIAAKLLKER